MGSPEFVDIRGQEHDPMTQNEPLKSKWLAFGDLGLQKQDRGVLVAVLSLVK